MKTNQRNSDLPSTGRLIIYLLVISGLCYLSSVTTVVKDHPDESSQSVYGKMDIDVPGNHLIRIK